MSTGTIGLILLVIILCLYVLFIHMHYVQQEKKLERKVEQLQLQVSHLSERRRAVIAWSEELEIGRKAISQLSKSAVQCNEFIYQFYVQQLHIANMKSFFSLVDKRLDGFAFRLEEHHPTLSDKEQALLICYALGLPEQDICLLLNYSTASLPTTKSRLCKKLGLTHASQLPGQISQLLDSI